MGIFDFFKKETETKRDDVKNTIKEPVRHGVARSRCIELDCQNEKSIRDFFIAFDVETTGLNPVTDRIIEVGAVIYKNGKVDKTFSSLVMPSIPISKAVSNVNHITNEMIAEAPSEKEVYAQLVDFLGDAICGKVIMYAHNAKFDFDFLCNTLSRLGFNANIEYIDTLSISRKYLHGLENYKQCTIEEHLGITNPLSHRAESDAESCGYILLRLLDLANAFWETERKQIEKSKPNTSELEVCAYVQSLILQKGGNTKSIRFRKNSSGYVDICCLYVFLRFKHTKKGNYILAKHDCKAIANFVTAPCAQSEGGTNYVRLYFSSPFELEALSEDIYTNFLDCYKSMEEYVSYRDYRKQKAEDSMRSMYALTDEDVSLLLNNAKKQEYIPCDASAMRGSQVLCNDIVINAVHSRVPLSEIQNLDDWNEGFNKGFPYWEKGERERKNGNLEQAVELFDKARMNGYMAPALYNSYALAYRQLKEYGNEIAILDEGIERIPDQSGIWGARRIKALNLLLAKQKKGDHQ